MANGELIFTSSGYFREGNAINPHVSKAADVVVLGEGRGSEIIIHPYMGTVATDNILYAVYLAESMDSSYVAVDVLGEQPDVVNAVQQARQQVDTLAEADAAGARQLFEKVTLFDGEITDRQQLVIGSATTSLCKLMNIDLDT